LHSLFSNNLLSFMNQALIRFAFPYTTLFRSQEHERAISRNEGTQRTDEKLYQSSHERGNGERSHDTQSIESDSRKIGQSHEQHAINFEHARQDVRRKRREFASDFDKWT